MNGVDDLDAAVEHAWQAVRAADWSAAHARWEHARRQFPRYAPAHIHSATALIETGRSDEALDALCDAVDRFADNAELILAVAACLQRIGRDADASAWLEGTAPLFPENPEIIVAFLIQASRRSDRDAVVRGAAVLESLHPGRIASDAGLTQMVSDAERQRGGNSRWKLPHGGDAGDRPSDGSAEALADCDLMMKFQSLGQNCEFGLTQRHFEAEPLGLLRWSAISLENLITALNEDFVGVGSRGETRLVEVGTEYMTAHTRYGMSSHTFIPIDKSKEQAIFDKHLLYLGFMRRKIIEDLQTGDHSFVYASEQDPPDHLIHDLHHALLRRGSRYLLFVRKSDARHPAGTVRYVCKGLIYGFIDRLGPDRLAHGDIWNISFHHWVGILRLAHGIRQRDGRIRQLAGSLRTVQGG